MSLTRATIKCVVPELQSSRAELSASAVASTREAAIARAVRALFGRSELTGKRVNAITNCTIAWTKLTPQMLDTMLAQNNPDVIAELAAAETPSPKLEVIPKRGSRDCNNCGGRIMILRDHDGVDCELDPVTVATGDVWFDRSKHEFHECKG